MTRISEQVKLIAAAPPWYVRVFGVLVLSADVYWWLREATPSEWLKILIELAKHGLLLAIGLACFYPEGLILVHNIIRRLPFFNRRTKPRGEG